MTYSRTLRGMRRAPVLIVAAALVTLAACSSGGSTAGSSSTFKTPADVLAKIPGCTNVQPDSSPQIMAREHATCDFGGTADEPGSLDAYTFSGTGQEGSWLKIAKGFGGVFVAGDGWLVQMDTTAQANTVRAAVGGQVQ